MTSIILFTCGLILLTRCASGAIGGAAAFLAMAGVLVLGLGK